MRWKNYEFVSEQQVRLHLRIKGVRDLEVASIAGAWTGPLAAHFSCLHNFGQELEHLFGNTASLKHAAHGVM